MDRRRATRARLFAVALVVAVAILAWLALRETGVARPFCSGDLAARPMHPM